MNVVRTTYNQWASSFTLRTFGFGDGKHCFLLFAFGLINKHFVHITSTSFSAFTRLRRFGKASSKSLKRSKEPYEAVAMGILQTKQSRLYFEDSASEYGTDLDKPAVLFINGWAMSARYWSPLAERLAPHFRIIRLDQSGTGRTTLTTSTPLFTIESFANEVSALIEHLRLPQFHLVGHSMGSMVTAELAHRYQTQTLSTTIIACGIFTYSAVQMAILSAFIRSTMNLKFLFHLDFFKRAFVQKATSRPIPKEYEKLLVDDFLNTDAEAAEKVGTFSLNPDILRQYRRQVVSIPSPLLLCVGTADKTIPPEGMTTLYETRLAEHPELSTRFVQFESVGHLPMLEATDEFASILSTHFTDAQNLVAAASV
jgi:pimeloyl-ACP methyl ester carboxylesterase